ncbi:MAG: haloacid dehalogenase [Candidatus Bathyarchaeia archaeon]
MSLTKFLDEIRENLLKKDEMLQEIQSLVRKTTRLAKQAIFLLHRNMTAEAENLLNEAGTNVNKLIGMMGSYPEICIGLIEISLQEYAEAKIFFEIIRKGTFISPRDVGVPGEFYLLGLADVIGELRRRSLDLMRKDDVKAAEECLNLMETIYNELIRHDELQALIPGLRRKCDIARRIIEATRGDITMESRRVILNNTMRELQRILESVTGYVKNK